MSDGPYRSLPMSPKWKQAAKRAYLSSFSPSEISEALQQAAERDCRAELSTGLLRKVTTLLIGPDEPGLFFDLRITDLNALHRECASTMEHGFVSNAIEALQNGERGQAALQWAAEASVSDRLLAGSRQIEEHVQREATDYRARSTRSRLEEAHGGVEVSGVARMMLRAPNAPARTRTVVYSGLDDGPAL
ncbi:hypothetical protein [Novosphingobium sp. Fuku2-ISO-50]|uniref:hypothetical protein n=1 Tax=Novosphingobium sp. Fuku2-ISO-50 TaxID=1739114 RepID=UPI00076DC5B0|nr:hypothetical protein [Novosphingobium sp. Fuku2-ISO-50]KUR75327.1 hypothetical protein AQZ50_15830 [Novosphingobium sp. Fuku2-ISO-50]